MGDADRLHDARPEPRQERQSDDQEVPARVRPGGDRVGGRARRGAADAVVTRGALETGSVRLHPEAEDRRDDEPERDDPEEEPIGQAAREQARGRDALAL
jgi:hypothetical protein